MPVRNHSTRQWIIPTRRKVVAWRLPTVVIARNERELRECPVCRLFSCPLAHDASVCAAKHGYLLADILAAVRSAQPPTRAAG